MACAHPGSLPSRRTSAARAADDLVSAVSAQVGFIAAAGTVVPDFASAGRTIRAAHQVLGALGPAAPPRRLHRLEDVRLRGLLTLLADDERLAAFSERELHRLQAADSAHGGRLEQALRAVLGNQRSKTAAASLAVSRPVLYERIALAEQALGVNLDDGESRTSLHVALLAADIRALTQSQEPPTP